eukprot:1853517-Prymnesium_polylepis.1
MPPRAAVVAPQPGVGGIAHAHERRAARLRRRQLHQHAEIHALEWPARRVDAVRHGRGRTAPCRAPGCQCAPRRGGGGGGGGAVGAVRLTAGRWRDVRERHVRRVKEHTEAKLLALPKGRRHREQPARRKSELQRRAERRTLLCPRGGAWHCIREPRLRSDARRPDGGGGGRQHTLGQRARELVAWRGKTGHVTEGGAPLGERDGADGQRRAVRLKRRLGHVVDTWLRAPPVVARSLEGCVVPHVERTLQQPLAAQGMRRGGSAAQPVGDLHSRRRRDGGAVVARWWRGGGAVVARGGEPGLRATHPRDTPVEAIVVLGAPPVVRHHQIDAACRRALHKAEEPLGSSGAATTCTYSSIK